VTSFPFAGSLVWAFAILTASTNKRQAETEKRIHAQSALSAEDVKQWAWFKTFMLESSEREVMV
jgi:hypothetical protein